MSFAKPCVSYCLKHLIFYHLAFILIYKINWLILNKQVLVVSGLYYIMNWWTSYRMDNATMINSFMRGRLELIHLSSYSYVSDLKKVLNVLQRWKGHSAFHCYLLMLNVASEISNILSWPFKREIEKHLHSKMFDFQRPIKWGYTLFIFENFWNTYSLLYAALRSEVKKKYCA